MSHDTWLILSYLAIIWGIYEIGLGKVFFLWLFIYPLIKVTNFIF